jgi:UDP-N-acetylmuramoyl-tripeptide--D-alanyl-D-alanine ligase
MFDPIYLLIFGLTAFNILISSLRHLHFIQLKEYRFDRFKTFIRYESGLLKLTNFISLIGFLISIYSLTIQSPLLFLGALIILLSGNLWILLTKGLFRFKPTKKALLIFAIANCLNIILFLSTTTISKLNQVLVFSLPILYITVIAFSPITRLAKDRVINKAANKLAGFPHLKVIGITGSYGKSSTKEFLYQLIKDHKKTIKTPKNINTDIGVAQFILQSDFQDKEVFIVEMGAYQKGEIKKICQMVEPEISILTAVHNQHLSLFGSQKNIAKAKFEIIENLRPGGHLFYNLDSPGMKYIQDFLLSHPVERTSISKQETLHPNKLLSDITQQQKSLKFKVNTTEFQAPITGKHFAENISLAILTAQKIKLTEKQIQASLQKLQLPENTFSIHQGIKKSVIYNDSYNSSPAGFHALIDTVEHKKPKGKKILVTRGMLELGKDEKQEHQKIANRLDQNFDLVITISLKSFHYFEDYLSEKKLKYITDPDQLINFLQEQLTENSLVLLENRVPSQLIKYLIPHKK